MGFKRVNLHTHSIFSDGTQTPEAVVEQLALSGVGYASLTDHDTIAGSPRFRDALQRANIGFIPGVEITTFHKGREFHLLAYGFDQNQPELTALLDSIRQTKMVETQGIAQSMRKSTKSSGSISNGHVELERAIQVVHQAGGKTFLAHPLETCGNVESVNKCLIEFTGFGIDGLEAWYGPYTQQQQLELADLAKEMGLLTCAGTDLHGAGSQDPQDQAVDMPDEEWSKFRKAVMHGLAQKAMRSEKSTGLDARQIPPPRRFHSRYLILRIILPVLFTIALFTSALWGLILPSFEQSLLDRKREMISELTNSAWSVLAYYEKSERDGLLTREEAQEQAIAQIQAMRYGKEGKDYFWLQDMTPRIIMHPYRTDLVGQDVSNFQDPNGVKIFVEFAKLVQKQGEGYIKYVWQWKDDPERIEAKESFVKGFEPWNWIIGTGLYIEDVQAEISRIETRVVNIALIITGSLVLLLLFIAAQGIQVENKRLEAEAGLRESNEKFRSLVEVTTEGVLLVLGKRCRYANPMLLDLLGYNADQLELFDLEDVLPRSGENKQAWELITGPQDESSFDGFLQDAQGRLIECAMTVSPITAEGHQGVVFTIRLIGIGGADRKSEGEQLWKLGEAAQNAEVGIFRAKPSNRGTIVELNNYGIALLKSLVDSDPINPNLDKFFETSEEFNHFLVALENTSSSVNYRSDTRLLDGSDISLLIQAILKRDENSDPLWIEGTIVDVTQFKRQLSEQESQCRELEKRLAFFFIPLDSIDTHFLTCQLDTPAADAAKLMVANHASSIVVITDSGSPLGMVTDEDIRARLVSKQLPADTVIQKIMSAPIPRIKASARVFEALLEMDKLGVQHLGVENAEGTISKVIEVGQLLHLKDYELSFAASMISEANDLEDIVEVTRRLPEQIKAMWERDENPVGITRILSKIADAATVRLIELSVSELGNPPADFCFIAAGSQGREELTLGSDQDNAIVYRDADSEEQIRRYEEYFQKLGRKVSEGLHEAGYAYCPGQIMASNSRWVLPVSGWKSVFREWIVKAEPQELLDFCIFFDLRHVYGAANLVDELVSTVRNLLKDQPIFFGHMARNLVQYRPIPYDSAPGSWNVKSYLLPFIGYARLYGLRYGIADQNTLERLDRLTAMGVMHQKSYLEYKNTFTFLLKKRLEDQIHQKLTGKTSTVPGLSMGVEDIQKIQGAYEQINIMLQRVSQDFLGGTQP